MASDTQETPLTVDEVLAIWRKRMKAEPGATHVWVQREEIEAITSYFGDVDAFKSKL